MAHPVQLALASLTCVYMMEFMMPYLRPLALGPRPSCTPCNRSANHLFEQEKHLPPKPLNFFDQCAAACFLTPRM